ncbi:MAG: potassium-transporting ATPase subunit KdpC [Acidimicrobiia bacterium]
MRRQLLPAILSMVIFTVLLGLLYPLVLTGIAQAAFSHKANGSLVEKNGTTVGSSLIAQAFVDKKGDPVPDYFQPRPSAAGYDPTYSSGSNLGPLNPALIAKCLKVKSHGKTICDPNTAPQRAKAYRAFNDLAPGVKVPVDAVTASGSGLDPDISVANALLQAHRVADTRGLSVAKVRSLIKQHTDGRPFGVLGEKTVNVLDLNLALDKLSA